MRWGKAVLLLTILASIASGCATFDERRLYGSTRKFLDSGAPPVTKRVCSAFIFIPDTIVSPLTVYQDAPQFAPESKGGHVYLSYLGFRILMASELKPVYKWSSGVVLGVFDTLWFPLAAIADSAWAIRN